jgi:tetratricopeptide (TPR) repeat protein
MVIAVSRLTPSAPFAVAEIQAAEIMRSRGQAAAGRRRLVALAPGNGADLYARQALVRALYHAGAYPEAVQVARNGGGEDLGALSALAASLIAMGDGEGAEAAFNRIIDLYPSDGPAWYNRATLRRWTLEDNHLDALGSALAATRNDGEAEIALRYAIAKELEDMGRHAESFAHLARGAALRRARLSYRVEVDVEAMLQIGRAFNATRMAAARPGRTDKPGPIFVLGLPRSGTTLVDRILSSHSQVTSLGETPDLAMAVMETTPRGGDRAEFIRATAAGNPAALAARFCERLAGHEPTVPYVIDKTPLNFLYVGLIALAMPEARIVHVRRSPVDVGYALYKTLFQTGCPYSYNLVDIGRYIGAYRRLTDHWRAVLPGRMIEVDYEAVVDDLPGEARRLVEACGLTWEQDCVDFHLNREPTATASAAQVRRPIYRDSVDLWSAYESELRPLRRTLAVEGVL